MNLWDQNSRIMVVLVEQSLALESEVLRELINHSDFKDVAIRVPALLFFPCQIVKYAFYYYGNFDLESVITDIDEELNFLVVFFGYEDG